ncbi:MAG: 2-oxo acid dehydrogenase subunit E2 [Limnothrix sp. CACIAM 69d]|nr:MAG: 2-oxo acid dehydrogenase subunit E2 [Limnothrix sp. CACIAM 69d]
MIHEVFMPALSSTMTEGKIVSWEKAPGDKVAKGETILIVESDKADMDVESFNEGYMAAIVVDAGGSAAVGSTIALIAETEAEIEAAKAQAAGLGGGASAPAATAPASAAAPVAAPAAAAPSNGASAPAASPSGRTIASPRAKKLAKELKVDLSGLKGSGPNGRIVAEDVERAAGRTPAAAPAPIAAPVAAPAAVAPAAAVAPLPPMPGQAVAMTTLQKAVVNNMMVSLSVPTFRVGYSITTDKLDTLYKQVKSKGVTMTALLAKAVALSLRKHPVVNAAYAPDAIAYRSDINIAVAVAMPDGGLITPVLKNADQVDLYSLSRNWQDLVTRARSKQLQPDEYTTGTFTLSNLGMFGVDRFDAILPPGQGAILAVGASKPTVVATDDGLLGVKRVMQVNLTADHRIIYGADSAGFLRDLAALIEGDVQSLTL